MRFRWRPLDQYLPTTDENAKGGIRGRLTSIYAKALVVLLCLAPRAWLCGLGCAGKPDGGGCVRPVDDADPIYAATYSVLDALERGGVPACLIMGSFLGAARHGEMHPFGEKDVDLGAWTTNVTRLREVLQGEVDAGVIKNTGGRSDFGLQLSVAQPTVLNSSAVLKCTITVLCSIYEHTT
jgi:hypothetical protein